MHVGTSGWSYDHWEHVLYPPGTPPRDRLAHYVRRFGTVELNSSFYRWPKPATFASWRRRLPEGFLLSVKAPRGLTHGKKLYAPEAWVERFARIAFDHPFKRGDELHYAKIYIFRRCSAVSLLSLRLLPQINLHMFAYIAAGSPPLSREACS